jgi:hypothetical protein
MCKLWGRIRIRIRIWIWIGLRLECRSQPCITLGLPGVILILRMANRNTCILYPNLFRFLASLLFYILSSFRFNVLLMFCFKNLFIIFLLLAFVLNIIFDLYNPSLSIFVISALESIMIVQNRFQLPVT